MKKRLIFEVEEGNTIYCDKCPFWVINEDEATCGDRNEIFNCTKYDLSTLKFKYEEDTKV